MKELWPKLQQLLPQMKMRLRASARRRLAVDIMALSTGLRGAAMLDYMPCTPPMLQQLCQLLFRISQDVHEVAALRVLHMEDCGYIIHPSNLLDYMHRSLNSPNRLLFVVLDDDSPRKASRAEHEEILKNLSGIRQGVSSILAQNVNSSSLTDAQESCGENAALGVIAAGNITSGSGILLPTLNGWLLGYPVVYFFVEENGSHAGRCVAGGAVQLHQVLLSSSLLSPSNSQNEAELKFDEDELLSFTVPSDLSPSGLGEEDWTVLFLQKMTESVARAPHVWKSVRMEVTTRRMDSMVL